MDEKAYSLMQVPGALRSGGTLKTVKAKDLEGQTVYLVGARGPYQSREYPGTEFVIFEVYTRDGELLALLMNYASKQRQALLDFFAEEETALVGPVRLVKAKTRRGHAWVFEDAEFEFPAPSFEQLDELRHGEA